MDKSGEVIVVEAGQVGLGIRVPLSVLETLPPVGEEVKIYTYLQVREDDLSLFGFLSRQDLDMFKQLIGVNGVGPKGALGILSALHPDELRTAVLTGDAKAISKAPGIGVKTAQRIILDLKDKISASQILSSLDGETKETSLPLTANAAREAAEALVALGYTNAEALRAIRQVTITDDMDAEAVLKQSLRFLAFL